MNSNSSEDPRCRFTFLNFQTKPSVSKSKLGGEFVKNGWNAFSSGFSESNRAVSSQIEPSLVKGGESNALKPKSDPEALRRQILSEGYKAKKRKLVIEHKDAEFFSLKAESLHSLLRKKSLQKQQHKKESDSCCLKKCTNSVFLEVQNIQNTFQQIKSIPLLKSSRFSSGCVSDFISDRASLKSGGQENVPKKSKVSYSSFFLPSDDFLLPVAVQKVQKASAFSAVYSLGVKEDSPKSDDSEKLIVVSKSPDLNCKSRITTEIKCIKDLKFRLNAVNVLADRKNCDIISCVNLTTLSEDESSRGKGSNWVQSLQWDLPAAPENAAPEDPIGKKKIRNILPGGFAEQIMKIQRREKSEKVLWDHKIDRNKKKGNVLSLMLTSVLFTGDIVIAKCLSGECHVSESYANNEKQISSSDDGITLLETLWTKEQSEVASTSKMIVVLFKRSIFMKLHLKIKSTIQVCAPWQMVHLPSMSCPVILCAKFIDFVSHSCESRQIEKYILCNVPSSLQTVDLPKNLIQNQHSLSNDEFFYRWGQSVLISARVQRIWKFETLNEYLSYKNVQNHFRYMMLLQVPDGSFHELVISFKHSVPDTWRDLVTQSEGKCYLFRNLYVTHRLCLKRHQQLRRILHSLSDHQDNVKELKQEFCYQLMFNCTSDIPKTICDKEFPVYCPISIEPLSTLFKKITVQRFTCIGKILFRLKNIFYISDESLVSCNPPKYVGLEFLFPFQTKDFHTDAAILVKEALFHEGCLLLDCYSKICLLSEISDTDEEFTLLNRKRLQELDYVNLQSVIVPINSTSRISEFVTLKGEITNVDESSAMTWLQCSLCQSENLVQDSNLVIYCEDCSRVVPKPILNVRMEVTVHCKDSPCLTVHVQLLSVTIKRILQINDTHQPQCCVGDVLGKNIGPLFCCVKSCHTAGNMQVFYLSEITTC